MTAYILTFAAVFTINIVYTYYIKAVQTSSAVSAGFWAMLVNGISNGVVLGYVDNHLLVIPACLGAFLGTVVGIRIDNKK